MVTICIGTDHGHLFQREVGQGRHFLRGLGQGHHIQRGAGQGHLTHEERGQGLNHLIIRGSLVVHHNIMITEYQDQTKMMHIGHLVCGNRDLGHLFLGGRGQGHLRGITHHQEDKTGIL